MATHSSILAWKIPGTQESGRLQSMGSHKSRVQLSIEKDLHPRINCTPIKKKKILGPELECPNPGS